MAARAGTKFVLPVVAPGFRGFNPIGGVRRNCFWRCRKWRNVLVAEGHGERPGSRGEPQRGHGFEEGRHGNVAVSWRGGTRRSQDSGWTRAEHE